MVACPQVSKHEKVVPLVQYTMSHHTRLGLARTVYIHRVCIFGDFPAKNTVYIYRIYYIYDIFIPKMPSSLQKMPSSLPKTPYIHK